MTERTPLRGKTALITGGSRGLGRAMVLAFADAGATVVVASRKHDLGEDVVRAVEQRGGRAAYHAVDVSRWNQLDGLVDETLDRFGRIDVLVNNVGKSPPYDRLADVDEAYFDAVCAVNLKGPFRLAVLVSEAMAAGGGGSIVNVSSSASARPEPLALPYAAAKAGLETVTKGLATAYAPTVRVNAIVPGPFRTDVSRAWDPERTADLAARTLLRRIAEPEEIIGAALYFASDWSSYTTGALLAVDGGSV
ncbi:SDR family NAD(P)-dependent oxidoreductase [Actinophytocola sp.]|uniref:SDR family NAD(P)-dependent oxidoreductase n=1 Tax=Actinophytocola sp. TaxID=1872138 RepID=UPI003D6B9271